MLSVKRMMRFTTQVVVNAPADKVFKYVADFHHHREWLRGEVETRKTSEGPLGPGSTFKAVGYGVSQYGPAKYEVDLIVTEYIPNERLAFERRALGGVCEGHFIDLEPEAVSGGTQVAVRQEVLRWGWLWLIPLAYLLMLPVTLALLPVDRWRKRRKVRRLKSRLDEW